MSKKAKSENKKRRLQEKRRRKAANKAYYASLRAQGINTKSVRARRMSKQSSLVNTTTHKGVIGKCGNIACKLCY